MKKKLRDIFLIIIVINPLLSFSQTNSNKTTKKVNNTKNYKVKVEQLKKQSNYFLKNNLDSAFYYLNKAIILSEEKKDTLLIADLNISLGILQYEAGNYTKALETDLLAFKQYKLLNNKLGIAKALNEIGTMYDILGNSEEAIINLEKALDIRLELSDSSAIYDSYNNIGVFYYYQNDFENALILYKKASGYGNKPSVLNNIGEVYYKLNDFDNALKYYKLESTPKSIFHYRQI